MAISKIILNGVTQMDVTGKTVTAGSMLNGVTALKNDGTDVTGNIPDMTLPSASSSTSSGTSKATITPTSSAQYLNIPTGYLDTAQYYTIAAASGWASNFVTGTFKGTTTGTAMDVTLDYTGNGYPIAVAIYPTEGPYNENSGDFYSLIKRYAVATYSMVKNQTDVAPDYSESSLKNTATVLYRYKSSSSSAITYSNGGYGGINSSTVRYTDTAASSGSATMFNIRAKNKMSVFIASTSYGFAANIEYTYNIIYSS